MGKKPTNFKQLILLKSPGSFKLLLALLADYNSVLEQTAFLTCRNYSMEDSV